ncbi:sulfur oxidation c-type cytochrome SoxA [Reinekea forsetii]|nr:sulfur oxidation c-type cytochrome SoxA [Reinekea forsetii]
MPNAKKSDADYQALVDQDIATFQSFFKKRFPDVALEDYKDGVYAIDENARFQWLDLEEFPPYEFEIEEGQILFETPFANGKSFADCFGDGRVRDQYPHYDEKREMVVTLELAINECLESNGEKPYSYKKGNIANVSAYIAYQSRGQKVAVDVNSAGAYDAYMEGKEFFYSKRGQFNISCADCHMRATGYNLRADIPSPAIGQVTHFPVHRSKWGQLGTLHRRYAGCNENIRAKAFAPQSPEYRNLEYFQTVMSNSLEFNGPGSRK